ncbi:hypothetical protein [Methylobacterium gnaphalii]|uniref:Uncharacterized protein n=1 Tax=Methylobacterium gnaphalii TaxID=1010610 RepID=A0A512JMG6_9HYPH|nr:hypothetical protein [Methylobacterium gnaphalii]GEP11033.1 hypothetical protein MGN01_28780 [Methylobacterium gnaphalii]GJD69627.1 hypothetical protein MMMDOFMJ_2564 [Methylobacterium gnaphalii]GLS50311.1 hypothetical protein GCM10007885_31630 [Methylobacterium gnaphalii]
MKLVLADRQFRPRSKARTITTRYTAMASYDHNATLLAFGTLVCAGLLLSFCAVGLCG